MGYWGGMFPDGASAAIGTPAVAAELALSSVTSSGKLDFARLRAHTAGAAGNAISVSLECSAANLSEVRIEETSTHVDIFILDTATTVADLAALVNTDSTVIEFIAGASNPSDIVELGDEFANADLTGGAESTLTQNNGYWDGHFPDDAEADDPPTVEPTSPEGASVLELALQNGLKVAYTWETGLFKSQDGKEHRAALLDDPRQSYSGSAFMPANLALETRVAIAQHAANGAVFSLGLPYEETTVAGVSGAIVTVQDATADLDWAVPGQRVLIQTGAGDDVQATEGVVQEVGANTLTLEADVDTDIATPGAAIMPLVPVLLEPEQAFPRYRSGCERWNIEARASRFGFPAAAIPGELTATLATHEVTFRAATAGVAVGMSLEVGGPLEIEMGIAADELGNFTMAVAVPTGTTLGELAAALNGGGLILMLGDFDPDAVLTGADEFTLTSFVGADAGGPGEMGRGATVTEIFGRPLWDRKLDNQQTMTDSIETGAPIVELGAIPFAAVEATVPDWGRHIAYEAPMSEWQWFKKFAGTVKGQWKSFYLPSFRADLTPTAAATSTTLTIDGSAGAYDLWAARGYAVLQVLQGSTYRYVRVTGAAVSGSNIVLTLEGDSLAAAAVDMLSWCELVHLEHDSVDVAFSANGFAVELTARVVQQ